jgi:4-hydroxy-tetrahydrodipicolinate reductase
MSDLKIVIPGAAGRMGRMLIKAVTETVGCMVHAALERPGSDAIGRDVGTVAGLPPQGVSITDDPLQAILHADAILDFTVPAATVEFAALAAQVRCVHVIGTTGLADADFAKLEAAARHGVIIQSGNMSLGVNLLAALVKKAAQALDPSYDIEIVEMHHRMKVDAPSGTALLLGQAAAEGRQISLKEKSVRVRDGHTGARNNGDIGFATLRGGTVVGDHTVMLAGPHERIELRHIAEDRSIFAQGAVKAALWGHGKKPGYYSMADVLGLSDG